MRARLWSVVVVVLLAGVVVLPGGVSASGLVVQWDPSVPVGVETFVRGVAPDGASGVRVEVWGVDGWVESEVGVIEDDGGFEVLLSFGADAVGVYTFRVVVDTVDVEVLSEEFEVTRTAPLETPDEPEVSDEPGTLDELGASSLVAPLVEEMVAEADPVTVSATNVPSRPVGALTRVWGRVSGLSGGEVFTEVDVGGEWTRSEATVSDATGYYQIPLTYGASSPGTYTWRVGATTPDGMVYSDTFTLTRTAPVVSVSASSAGSRVVGALTRVWGRVDGYTGGRVFTEVMTSNGWSRSQIATSDATGYYQIPLTYGSNSVGTYTWRVGAITPDGTVYSDPFQFIRTAPAPVVSVSASSAGTRTVGALTYAWGRVSGHSGGQVFTEVMTSNGWSRSRTSTSSRTGYYQIPLTYGANTAGTYTYRVGANTPTGTVYSNAFRLTRTPLPRPPAGSSLDCSAQPNGKAIMVDKVAMRAWLCRSGAAVSGSMPFTSGPTYQAPRGVYQVYFKRNPWWSAGGRYRLDHFTGFARGVNGDRIGFHKYVIMQESQVGTEAWRNRSAGCFRMRARDAQTLYQFAELGTVVRVLNNG